ncbi:MAG TPA: ATP-binding cassette domain-containing protein [Thermoanaerobaculia bacterium]|nr:ATP-binding cassette domain-containing protein [Thermoanaerobaculia bacterium]
MSSSPVPIRVESVTKRFGDFTAVDRISFDVPQGRIFGILGPNGAGKTTTIRMIMNITIPDSGRVLILGRPSTEGGSRAIGYLPEERGLYRKMKVLDHIVFLAEIRGVTGSEARRRAAEWLERVQLSEWGGKKVEELSKGMQQKIQFIGCVIHDPEVLILDEPFSGLDPVNARALKDLFVDLRERGKTLVLCTHVMEQAEKLCDEIVLINRSRLVLEGRLDEIKRRYSGNRFVLRGEGSPDALRAIPGVRGIEARDGTVLIDLDDSTPRAAFLREATRAWAIESATPHAASLDEIFIQVVGQSVDEIEESTGQKKEAVA